MTYLDSAKFVEASTNSSRLVAKLKGTVQRQEYYETHQILRTVYFRFSNNKEKLSALLNLLYHGSIYLLKYREFISGLDTALLLLEIGAKILQQRQDDATSPAKKELKSLISNSSLTNHMMNNTPDISICQKVANLAVGLPDGEQSRVRFVAETLKILSPKLLNRDLLHNALANVFWDSKEYAGARYHFLHCANLENAQNVAALLVEYQSKNAPKTEVDLFITQFILQFLCLQCPLDPPGPVGLGNNDNLKPSTQTVNTPVIKKLRSTIKSIASQILTSYALKHPDLGQVDIPFSSLPLLNFTHFIINILDSKQVEKTTYQLLCDIYKVSWSRDPNYQNYLSRIGTIYFGIVDIVKQQQQQQQRGGGFFNNILMSLLDGPDEDETDDVESHQGGNRTTNNNMSSCDELD